MSTIVQLADKAARRFRDPNHEVISCDAWCDYLNQAWQTIQQTTSQWPWNKNADDISVTVASGQRQGCLSETSEVLEVRSVIDVTNQRALRQNTGNGAEQQLEGNINTATSASPTYYRMKGNEIELYPTPSQNITLTIRAVKWVGTFVGSETPPIPVAFQSVLIDGALALAHMDDENESLARANSDRFNGGIQAMLGSFLNGQEDKYPLLTIS